MSVDETPWVRTCPRCGNRDPSTQIPLTLGTAPICSDCTLNPWKTASGHALILHYQCMACKQRYLIPTVNPDEQLLELFNP